MAVRRLQKDLQKLIESPVEGIVVAPLPENILVWHYVMMGAPNTPYFGTLCLSISDYHPETWNPGWSAGSILLGLLSFMNDEDFAAGVVHPPPSNEVREKMAIESHAYNNKNPTFCRLFPGFGDLADLGCGDDEPIPSTAEVEDKAENVKKRNHAADGLLNVVENKLGCSSPEFTMAPSVTATQRLKKDYQKLLKEPVPLMQAHPVSSNILEWRYVIFGAPSTPFEGGVYHGKLIFPADFPFKPPAIIMLTPNGRFQTNTRLCLSISDFHPDTWNPAWTVGTIITGLMSFMNETAPTLGSIITSDAEKRLLAKRSKSFNLKDRVYCDLFTNLVEEHRKELADHGPQEEESLREEEERRRDRTPSSGLSSLVSNLIVIAGVVALAVNGSYFWHPDSPAPLYKTAVLFRFPFPAAFLRQCDKTCALSTDSHPAPNCTYRSLLALLEYYVTMNCDPKTFMNKPLIQNLVAAAGLCTICTLVVVWKCTCEDFEQTQSAKLRQDAHLGTTTRELPATFLLMAIMSSPNQTADREIIRQTWLKLTMKGPDVVRHVFPIGIKGLSTNELTALSEEQLNHGDLALIGNLYEDYVNLAKKTLQTMEYAFQNYKFSYLLKVDSDSFVRVGTVIKSLKDINHPRLYWGFLDGRAKPIRKGKWRETDWNLCDRYLPYQLGGGYVLSYELVRFLATNARLFKLYKNEDVSVGAWLAGLDIKYLHDPRFDTEWTSRGCNNQYIITHKKSGDQMQELYQNLLEKKVLCTREFRSRPSYVYDWSALPSECCKRDNASSIP
ncbi:unnamed protein product, partial [Mesorhabditis spiculigera]